MRWMGPGGHIMAYPIKNNKVYNMVLIHPQKPNVEHTGSWTNKGDRKEMIEFYKRWNDAVRDLLSYVPEGDIMPLKPSKMLTVSLSLADDGSTALGLYEVIRKSRGEAVQNSAATTRTALHLPYGPEQEKRDKAITGTGPNPDL
ncbi:hypothetical protein OEA41_002557 [Lepraria neglecta]|uniref:Uncharacterized protein n=1 Tax=Lepraria neglecta TaxID=209136 RepID=A0AAD9ZC75_9LECA|nr:hypothetical protein OEA41_002557 [Lepraria neglecta]